MKSLGLLIILGLAGFLIYPLAMERTRGECRALSRQIVPVTAAGVAGQTNSGATPLAAPTLAAHIAAARALPGWPPFAGCAWLYWHFVFNPPG
jgi:hypothetical protein